VKPLARIVSLSEDEFWREAKVAKVESQGGSHSSSSNSRRADTLKYEMLARGRGAGSTRTANTTTKLK
jgi:hypothetical protein